MQTSYIKICSFMGSSKPPVSAEFVLAPRRECMNNNAQLCILTQGLFAFLTQPMIGTQVRNLPFFFFSIYIAQNRLAKQGFELLAQRSEGCELESHPGETQWCLRFHNIEISLCISHSDSLCDWDYPPDLLDQKLG